MNAKKKLKLLVRGLCTVVFAMFATAWVHADPLPGRDVLKFSQKPLDGFTIVDATGLGQSFFGHDELSTAYGAVDATGVVPLYRGRFMADDFADGFNSPVVHVKWWGSYLNNIIDPAFAVDKFLITFESDVPANPTDPTSFSQPGIPLLNQIVRRGPLAPGSGTYTETPISPGGAPLFETLYEYNAELHLGKEFPEKKDEVYWLKIVALVDLPPGVNIDPINPPTNVTQWGWHNRDYSIMDPLASVPPAVVPGEHSPGVVPGTGIPVWHFQDDAITGIVAVDTTLNPNGQIMPDVFQDPFTFNPTNYLDGIDGPAGPIPGTGISQFSKDLAFELYTVIPEPATCMLMLLGLGAIAGCRRHR